MPAGSRRSRAAGPTPATTWKWAPHCWLRCWSPWSEAWVSSRRCCAVSADRDRFPGFDALAQQRHWDPVTAGVVLERVSNVRDFRFFTPGEQAVATVLCDRLLGQRGDGRIPVAA